MSQWFDICMDEPIDVFFGLDRIFIFEIEYNEIEDNNE